MECEGLSWTAEIIYALLLDRAQLSKKNRWIDGDGRIYIQFSNASLAKAIHKSETPVRNALRELEKAGLIEKKSKSGSANIIYLKLPDSPESQSKPCLKTDTPPVQKQTPPCLETDTGSVQKRTASHTKIVNLKMESAPRKLYGCYQNVPLSDEEYTGLSETIPELPRLIDKMSCHCESTGRTYRNYAATLRKWYFQDEDKKKQAGTPASNKRMKDLR